MRLLLDTNAFLYFLMGDPRLSHNAREAIDNPASEKLISAASLWEIAIKISLGKLTLAEPFDILMPREIRRSGFLVLPIELPHTAALCTLPFHHRDPFDRLIIAQTMVESIPVVSSDSAFDAYLITRIW